MTLHIPANYWQCKLRWRLAGDPDEMISTIGLVGHDPGPRPIIEVAQAVWDAWYGSWPAGEMSNQWSFVGVDAQTGGGDVALDVGSWDMVQAGGGNWGPVPSNCSLLIRKKTALGGRSNVGRMFIPPAYLSEGEVSATGAISSAAYAFYQDHANNFYDSLTDTLATVTSPPADFQPVLFHNDPSRTPTPITSLSVDAMLATQRQRMRR